VGGMSGGLDPFPDRSRIAELYRERTGQELVLDGVTQPRDLGHFNCAGRYVMPKEQPVRDAIAWPFTITLPWSCLVSDNVKHRAMLRGTQPAMVINRGYADAEEKIRTLAASRVVGCAPAAVPLALTARVWMPDNRVHDLTNSCKLVHDALEGAVYENDRWLYDVHWIRAGVDVDAPRAEITILPLPPSL
jgi:Holliday junction resolvase RusA-like endonuclease